ncbi:MAG: transglutaminase domain-containing protein [Paludibacteraceae bacterium]
MKKRILLLTGLYLLNMTLSAATVKDSILALVPSSSEVFRYGYSELAPADQVQYDQILNAILQFDANMAGGIDHRVDIPWSSDMTALMAMLRRMYTDVPQLWVLYNYIPRYNSDTYTYQARISTVNTPESFLHDLLTIDTVFRKITAPITPAMSTYHKLKVLHDGFIAEVSYGNMSGANAGNIKGALIEKQAVCEGFSRAFLYLCQGVGIKCVYVTGSNANGNHAWNHVEVDGKWYVVDLTTDGAFAGYCGYDGFLRGQAYFDTHYTISSDNVPYNQLPTLADDDCSEPEQHPTSVEGVLALPSIDITRPMYNVMGQRVGANYRGIVIQNGTKYFLNK